MKDKFDELAKGLAQSVTRRGAMKRFGVGFASVVLATIGLAGKASATPKLGGHDDRCSAQKPCAPGLVCCPRSRKINITYCSYYPSECYLGG
jgi:hypothetical protein